MEDAADPYDVLIVGGGPAGLNAALVLGRCRRRVVLIDGGQPRNAAARELHCFLGRDGTSPATLREDGRRELRPYGVEIVDDDVVDVRAEEGHDRFPTGFALTTRAGRRFNGRKLLLATGVRDVLPEFPGFRECYGVSVHHCPYCDGWEHRDRPLLAYSSMPRAGVGLGMLLRCWTDQVTVLSDGEPFDDVERDRARRCGLSIREERVGRLVHDEGRLLGVDLHSGTLLPAHGLFFDVSPHHTGELPRMLGCRLDHGVAPTKTKQRTGVPGLYIAGDADGDVQFAIVAAAEGATAGVAINRELHDEDHA